MRGDLSFFDELEALDDHRLATEQAYTILNQRERELEDQLHSKKKSALVSSSAQRSFPVSAAVTNESNGWKKGFLGKKSTTPLVASTIIHADVASVSTTTQNDSSIVTMSSSTSSSAPPAQAIKAPALAKSRAVKDVVIERFP